MRVVRGALVDLLRKCTVRACVRAEKIRHTRITQRTRVRAHAHAHLDADDMGRAGRGERDREDGGPQYPGRLGAEAISRVPAHA